MLLLCFPTSPVVLQHYLAKEEIQKTAHWCFVRATQSNCCSALDFLSPVPCPPKAPSLKVFSNTCNTSFPSNRHHRSNGDCLEGKRENYQVCSVQYCVQQLYTVNCTHIQNRTNSSLDWILFHWAHFTMLRFHFCVCIILCLTVYCMHV